MTSKKKYIRPYFNAISINEEQLLCQSPATYAKPRPTDGVTVVRTLTDEWGQSNKLNENSEIWSE